MGTLRAIAYTEAALAALASVQPKKIRQQIKNRIDKLADDAKPPGCAKIMGAIQDGTGEVYRVRQGDHRIIYRIDGDTEIVILDIGHRKDIYR